MIKEMIFFDYSEQIPHEEAEHWYFDGYAPLVRKLPHLIKYVTYRMIHLPKNDFIPAPQFSCLEELWWPTKEAFNIAQNSDEHKEVEENLTHFKRGPWLANVKRVLLEKERNVLHPEMNGNFQATMNELNGKPHIKSLWSIDYLSGLDVGEAENWYLNHHILVAARNFNLVRYVTYTPAKEVGREYRFVRFTELCWRDWETMLNDFASPRGQEVLEDNKNEQGIWRVISRTPLLDHPHVAGNEVVFL